MKKIIGFLFLIIGIGLIVLDFKVKSSKTIIDAEGNFHEISRFTVESSGNLLADISFYIGYYLFTIIGIALLFTSHLFFKGKKSITQER